MRNSILVILLLCFLNPSQESLAVGLSSHQEKSSIEVKLKNMTLEQKVGQLFIIGIPGKSFTPQMRQILRAVKPGGVLLFGRNIASARSVHKLNSDLQTYAQETLGTPLLIAVDQEGDKVTRIKTFPRLISPLSVGQTRVPELAYRKGKIVGHLLRSLGFNMNLAPVLDLADPKKPSFIGTRSYDLEPETVAIMADNYIRGQSEHSVLATAKHFPSHGHTEGDSHYSLTQSSLSLEQLNERDLVPYKRLIQNDHLDSVLVAHIAFPNIDGRTIPATFSKQLVSKVLRDDLDFTGISVTDDLEMAGAKLFKTSGQKAIEALRAGNDLLMFAWNSRAQKAAYKGLLQAVKKGEVTESRIDQSVRRILKIKEKYKVGQVEPLSREERRNLIVNKDLASLTKEILLKHANSDSQKISTPSIISKKQPAVVFSAYRSFAISFRREFKRGSVRFYRLSKSFKATHLLNALEAHPRSTVLYHMTGSSSRKLLASIGPAYSKRIIVVNSMTPGDIKLPSMYKKILNFYSNYPWLGQAVAKKLGPQNPMAIQRSNASERLDGR